MKRSIGVAVSVCLWLVTSANAHDIKVFASQQALDKPGKTTIYLCWGHQMPVDDLIDGKSIERYECRSPSGVVEPLTTDDYSLQAHVVEIKEAGVSQVVVNRRISVFSHVIDVEGNRLLKRGPKAAIKEGKIESSLRSVQCGKALIVLGSSSAVTAVGQAIEIVPQDGPDRWQTGNSLRFQVLHNGKPLPSATVLASYVGFRPANAWCCSTTGDRDGMAVVRVAQPGVAQPGTWVLRVNTREPAGGAALADYDCTSYTATLSFEVRP